MKSNQELEKLINELFDTFGASQRTRQMDSYYFNLAAYDTMAVKSVIQEIIRYGKKLPSLAEILEQIPEAKTGRRECPDPGESWEHYYDRLFRQMYKKLHGVDYPEECEAHKDDWVEGWKKKL